MSEIPGVEVLKAIKPINSGTGDEVLLYDELVSVVNAYKLTNFERSAAVWESQEESLEEFSAARQLAFEYLLRTAIEVTDPSRGNYDLWADRFTQATVELV